MLYVACFFLWWTCYELVDIQLFHNPVMQALSGSLIKFATWTVPAMFLIKKYNDAVAIPLVKMFTNRFKLLPYGFIALLMVGYVLAGEWVEKGNLAISASFNPIDLIGIFFFVGITEELVFRGWLLNAFLKKMKQIPAIVLSSLLFLAIHFPIWLKTGSFLVMFTSGAFLNVLVLSVIFSMLFIKSKNILVPIVIHMLWDLALLLF